VVPEPAISDLRRRLSSTRRSPPPAVRANRAVARRPRDRARSRRARRRCSAWFAGRGRRRVRWSQTTIPSLVKVVTTGASVASFRERRLLSDTAINGITRAKTHRQSDQGFSMFRHRLRRAAIVRVYYSPIWSISGLPTAARRAPGHHNDPSLQESPCFKDSGGRTDQDTSICQVHDHRLLCACSTLFSVGLIQSCCF
jgi:hypothetical protein